MGLVAAAVGVGAAAEAAAVADVADADSVALADFVGRFGCRSDQDDPELFGPFASNRRSSVQL